MTSNGAKREIFFASEGSSIEGWSTPGPFCNATFVPSPKGIFGSQGIWLTGGRKKGGGRATADRWIWETKGIAGLLETIEIKVLTSS